MRARFRAGHIAWHLATCGAAGAAMADTQALELPPNATLALESVDAEGRYPLPTAPWANGILPVMPAEGVVLRQVWRIDAPGATTLALLVPLRAQLLAQGYDILVDCTTEVCGGFDFRFATDVAPPPEMYVDLGDFRFVSARNGAGDAASILVSRSPFALFVQIMRVTPAGAAAPPQAVTDGPGLRAAPTGDFGRDLEGNGSVILSDLTFATGDAELGPGPFPSLDALAAYLHAAPGLRVALVGHTDATGALDGNIALSRRRAASVLDRLVRDYGISVSQLDAQGMGYLAPVATNLTEAGREANRRVEVIVLPEP